MEGLQSQVERLLVMQDEMASHIRTLQESTATTDIRMATLISRPVQSCIRWLYLETNFDQPR